MRPNKYILDENGEPKAEPDLMIWAHWFERAEERIVARSEIGPYTVSTVFLGLDHSWSDGPPVLWETMVFMRDGDGHQRFTDLEMNRCSGGREQAEKMHEDTCERVAAIFSLEGNAAGE